MNISRRHINILVFLGGAMSVGIAAGWWAAKITVPPEDAPTAFLSKVEFRGSHQDPILGSDSPSFTAARDDSGIPAEVGISQVAMRRFFEELDQNGMCLVDEKALEGLKLRAVSNGVVSEEIKQALALSSDEVNELNQILLRVEEDLNNADLAGLEVIEMTEQSITFMIADSGETGENIRREFEANIVAELGEEDAKLFLSFASLDNLISPWDLFGMFDRIVSFSVIPADDGRVRIQFQQTYADPDKVRAYFAERGTY